MTTMAQFLRGRTVQVSEHERGLLEGAVSAVRRMPARATLVERGKRLRQSTMLVAGYMIRFIDDDEGARQVVAFQVPGDFVDLHGYPLLALDHAIGTVTQVQIGIVPHSAIDRLIHEDADLGRKLWFATLLDAAMHREWLFRLGRLDAPGRVAHFFAETETRLKAVGIGDERRFPLPVTQTDLADILGLTPIHVNRVLRALREEKICTFRSGIVQIHDWDRLIRRSQFDPAYLYLRSDQDLAHSIMEEQDTA